MRYIDIDLDIYLFTSYFITATLNTDNVCDAKQGPRALVLLSPKLCTNKFVQGSSGF